MAVAYFFGLRHGSQSKTILIALPAPPQFSAEERRVIAALQSDPKPVGQLLHETGFHTNLLEAVLIDLQDIDAIRLYADGQYYLRPDLREYGAR